MPCTAAGADSPPPRRDLAVVWGETVSLRHLSWALLISLPATVVIFFLGHALLARTLDDPKEATTFSLLVGLAAVVACAVLCARLFSPQRIIVTDGSGNASATEATIEELAGTAHGLGKVADLPVEVQRELSDAGLRRAFERAEARISGQTRGEAAATADRPGEEEPHRA